MVDFLIYGMIYAGSALMVWNIHQYISFSREIRRKGDWKEERRILNVPIILLILFLAGYVLVPLFGKPDLLIGGIFLGGSIFVTIMLTVIKRIAKKIQENEHLEADLLAAKKASEAKTFFLSNMSHDIRTPLNAVIGYANLGRDAQEGEKTEYFKKILQAADHLLSIVNDVLEMSRIENGKLILEEKPVNIQETVQKAFDLMQNQMKSKEIDYQLCVSVLSHPWVLCDANRLNRAFMNLLSNAFKFTPEKGKVTMSLEETEYHSETVACRIVVEDNGIGMNPDFLQHIFTPFERERTSTASRIEGTGLGMAITKNIIDAMGGEIIVESEEGKGSRFTLLLHFKTAEAPVSVSPKKSEQKIAFVGKRLLITEDNPINREIIVMMLKDTGFEIETAEDGKEALDQIIAHEPGYYDLVLMDIQMPVMDGYTAAGKIRNLEDQKKASVPIVAMTANAFQEDIEKAKAAGMNGHIAKPLNIEEVLHTIEKVLTQGAAYED